MVDPIVKYITLGLYSLCILLYISPYLHISLSTFSLLHLFTYSLLDLFTFSRLSLSFFLSISLTFSPTLLIIHISGLSILIIPGKHPTISLILLLENLITNHNCYQMMLGTDCQMFCPPFCKMIGALISGYKVNIRLIITYYRYIVHIEKITRNRSY